MKTGELPDADGPMVVRFWGTGKWDDDDDVFCQKNHSGWSSSPHRPCESSSSSYWRCLKLRCRHSAVLSKVIVVLSLFGVWRQLYYLSVTPSSTHASFLPPSSSNTLLPVRLPVVDTLGPNVTTTLFPVKRIHTNNNTNNDPNVIVFRAATTATPHDTNTNITHNKRPMLAICAASRVGSKIISVQETELQKHLIQSIAQTVTLAEATLEWDVHLFVAVDDTDDFWVQQNQMSQIKIPAWLTVTFGIFPTIIANRIPFNEIIKVAYNAGAEYICRVNDDTAFATHGWISVGVAALQQYDPPNVGVVGPDCPEGNYLILTHDMVHRTHMDIFHQSYYPVEFKNWFLDDWITMQYSNCRLGVDRSTRLTEQQWRVRHRMSFMRYSPSAGDGQLFLPVTLSRGQELILRYLQRHFPNHTTTRTVAQYHAHQRLYPVRQQQQQPQQQQHLGDHETSSRSISSQAKEEEQWMQLIAATRGAPPRQTKKKPILAILTTVPSGERLRLQRDLIQSIATTVTISEATEMWDVHLFVAVEKNGNDDNLLWVLDNRHQFLDLGIPAWLTVTVVGNSSLPEIAQVAYQAGAQYFCRAPHNIEFQALGWISIGVAALQSYDPPNLGLVGPDCPEQGTIHHLATHMVHRTHMRMFDQKFYPDDIHTFHSWYLDKWIHAQYANHTLGGVDRSTKLDWQEWLVRQRWSSSGLYPNERRRQSDEMVRDAVIRGRRNILHYLQKHHANHTTTAAVAFWQEHHANETGLVIDDDESKSDNGGFDDDALDTFDDMLE